VWVLLQVTLGVRLTETDRFGYSVPQQIRFLGLVAPIGSKVNWEPRLFGFGYFGSVSVITERTEIFRNQKTCHSVKNFSSILPHFDVIKYQLGQYREHNSIKQQNTSTHNDTTQYYKRDVQPSMSTCTHPSMSTCTHKNTSITSYVGVQQQQGSSKHSSPAAASIVVQQQHTGTQAHTGCTFTSHEALPLHTTTSTSTSSKAASLKQYLQTETSKKIFLFMMKMIYTHIFDSHGLVPDL
jgi:hypothetical protein